jgi:hypothetical protein
MSRFQGVRRGGRVFPAAVFLAAVAVVAAAQAAGPAPISGTIASIKGNLVTLTLADKAVKEVVLQDRTLILERDTAAVGDIRAGDAMGVAARRSGTDLIATSINIFSRELWDVVRKGQWPMASGETMTNAMVTDYAEGMSGHTLTMKYKEGTATIIVPDGIPVHRLVTVKPAALSVGLLITVRGTASSDGRLTAASISFEGPGRG